MALPYFYALLPISAIFIPKLKPFQLTIDILDGIIYAEFFGFPTT